VVSGEGHSGSFDEREIGGRAEYGGERSPIEPGGVIRCPWKPDVVEQWRARAPERAASAEMAKLQRRFVIGQEYVIRGAPEFTRRLKFVGPPEDRRPGSAGLSARSESAQIKQLARGCAENCAPASKQQRSGTLS
jgi:hypothetical protein